ncbi:cohesin domain-containing protein, partial [Candidatus Marithioploca araucensis]|nr:cohesin domain-containing protein [Candidatus Marithioploca araucensis]
MKLNFNKREPMIPNTNLGPPKRQTCPSSSWRSVVFVAFIVGMMAMFASNQVQAAPGPPNVITGLTVNKIGDGTISANGINCGTDCDEDYVIDTQVALTASPANDFNFANWTGDCTGTNPNVTVTMDAFFKTCTANFVPAEFIITTIAGNGTPGYSGDGDLAINAELNHPTGGTIDDIGNLYFSDWDNHAIRKINLNTGIITTFAGGVLGGGFKHPGSYIDSMGNLLYISDYGNHVIYKVNSDGTTTLIAGTIGVAGYKDGPAVDAKFNHPAMLIKEGNNLYIGDFYNHRIRKMDLNTNVVETIAGTGGAGYNGDNIPATTAKLYYPGGLALVKDGTDKFLYIGDYYNHRIRKLDINSGIITTVAGNGTSGYGGDSGLATDAQLNVPTIAVFDSVGNMYITDHLNHVIRKVDTSGIITTIAGIPNSGGYNGDNILADQAKLNLPLGVIVENEDNLYIADYENHRIRKLTSNYFKYQVDLQRKTPKPDSSWKTTLDISLGTETNATNYPPNTCDSNGQGYIAIKGTLGNNDYICVKNAHTLANKIGPPIVPNGNGIVDFGLLLEGDTDGDNVLSVNDFSLVFASKDKCIGDTGYNANANFNVDNCVDIDDANFLKSPPIGNMGQTSECTWNDDDMLRRGVRDGAGTVTLITTVIPTDLTVGESFEYSINVQAGTQLVDAAAAYLNFDPEQLQVNHLTAGDKFDFVLQEEFDNTNGHINFAAGVWDNEVPKGLFTLVTINMTVLQADGEKTLSFNTTVPR